MWVNIIKLSGLMIVIVVMGFLFLKKTRSDIVSAVVVVICFWIARILWGYYLRNGSIDFYPLSLVNIFILSLIFIFGFIRIRGETLKDFGWRREGFLKNSAIGLIVGFVIGIIGQDLEDIEIGLLLSGAIFGFLIASWQEENIFRGYLQKVLGERIGKEEAIVIQGVVFGIAHIGFFPFYPLPIFIVSIVFAILIGILFGFLRYKTGSIASCFVAHGIIDTMKLYRG